MTVRVFAEQQPPSPLPLERAPAGAGRAWHEDIAAQPRPPALPIWPSARDFSNIPLHAGARGAGDGAGAGSAPLQPGPGTPADLPVESKSPGPEPIRNCPVTSASFTTIPAEGVVLMAEIEDNRLQKRFDIAAKFRGADHRDACGCGPAVYRQYVRGWYFKNEQSEGKRGGGAVAGSEDYEEDCNSEGCYGHRENYNPPAYDRYFLNGNPGPVAQEYGCDYVGHDVPYLRGKSGDRLLMHLYFIGRLINLRTKEKFAERKWSVRGVKTVP